MRSKHLRIAYCRSSINPRNDATAQKRWDKGLDTYAKARSEGIQPASTRSRDVVDAKRISDHEGKAFGVNRSLEVVG